MIKIKLTKSDQNVQGGKSIPLMAIKVKYVLHSRFNNEERTDEWGLLDKHANFVFWDNFPSVDKHKGQTWKAQGFCVLNPYLVIVSSIKANPVYLICKVKASAAKW